MRTRTIFEAYDRTYRGLDWIIPPKRARQNDKFRAELLRRMDNYDRMRGPTISAPSAWLDDGANTSVVITTTTKKKGDPQRWADGTPLWW